MRDKEWAGQSVRHTLLVMPWYMLRIKLDTAGYSKASFCPQGANGLNRQRTLALMNLFESNSSLKVLNGRILSGIHSPRCVMFLHICKP